MISSIEEIILDFLHHNSEKGTVARSVDGTGLSMS